MTDAIVIVGGGQSAFSLAAKLRALRDPRPITILSAEDVLPYQRPPLSKKYLLGEMSFDRLQFRPAAWYAEQEIVVRLSTWVERIERDNRMIIVQDGSSVPYGTLVLATGAEPRRLPAAIGGDLQGVHVVRNKRDVDHIAAEMKPGRRLLVVGGGYIGLEAAAVARRLDLQVTVLEMADRILQRVAARETSDVMRDLHRSHGVAIREKAGLRRLVGRDERVVGAELPDGTIVDIDLAIVGIGVLPRDTLAKEAGLDVANGILVDAQARTSDPDIFAVGDCTDQVWQGERVRLESVQNAVEQAEACACVIAGGTAPYEPKPWFWSDQFDTKLQIAGLNRGYDDVLTRPGGRPGAHSVWYFKNNRLIAVDAINDARAYASGKKMIEAGFTPHRAELADAAVDLKQLLGAL